MRLLTDFEVRHAWVAGQVHHYIDEGAGPALVMIHGSLCDCRYWDAQIKALRTRFRVIAPSLRHYWPARWDDQGIGFSVTSHASDVIALLRHLGVERAHWIGHSRGGRVALEAAIANRADPGAMLDLLTAEDDPALFLRGDVYGTRCTTLLAIAADGGAQMVERRYEAGGRPAGTTALEFRIG